MPDIPTATGLVNATGVWKRPTGVEPVIRAWKALVLPLHHGRAVHRD
jgi:hypothetical protein